MATKEDILEQIVEEYLVHKGYFVQHNLKFLPRKDHPDFVTNQYSWLETVFQQLQSAGDFIHFRKLAIHQF